MGKFLDGVNGIDKNEFKKLQDIDEKDEVFKELKHTPEMFGLFDLLNEELITTFKSKKYTREHKQKTFELYTRIHEKFDTTLDSRLSLIDLESLDLFDKIHSKFKIIKGKKGYEIKINNIVLNDLYFKDLPSTEFVVYLISNMLYKYKRSISNNPGNEFLQLPNDKKFTHFDVDKYGDIQMNFIGTEINQKGEKNVDSYMIYLTDYTLNQLNINNIGSIEFSDKNLDTENKNQDIRLKTEMIIDFAHRIIEQGII